MQTRLSFLLAVISLGVPQVYASNFTFSYGNASQCEDFNITWSGGTAPYELTIVPSFNTPLTYSIPSSSYSNNQGSYSLQLTANASVQFVAVMSDASGFGTGGVSDVITVGAGSSGCDRSWQVVDFYYDTDMALSQCRTYSFTNYTGAVQPVSITGLVPGGTTFVLNPPKGPTDFEWIADVAAGTGLIFFMADSKGHSGGSTQLDTVGLSGDPSCLTGAYPSSLSVHPSSTATSAPASGNTGTSSPTGAIVGAVVGGLVGLGLIAAAVFIYLRRERQKGRYGQGGTFPYRGTRPQKDEVDLAGDDVPPPDVVQPYPYFHPTGSVHSQGQQSIRGASIGGAQSTVSLMRPMSYAESQGYAHPDQYGQGVATHSRNTSLMDGAGISRSQTQSQIQSQTRSRTQSQTLSQAPSQAQSQAQSQTFSSASRRKAAMAGIGPYQSAAPRFILHTDAEDVVELPRNSDDRRASGSGTASTTYPPPPISIPPGAAMPDSARPPSSIIEEDHPHMGLPEPMAPSSTRSPVPAPPFPAPPYVSNPT
ncbi:uncharacterized protein B0H18DRAFT_968837 [Fomitopsis serialis]|uniref:uncharacterized protein n=1 Tax=Fomitopsis serialis TaxID=139415 RepID=UPI002007F827|nr:uncharacterized protein B0H18DRAFT_968837 [Neoantrodia serialis]KAH9937031.1 hypothetical protein B0H18DRAFT_968837 [Neoantrodia serialis]